MTLAAAFSVHGCPILFGDLLVTTSCPAPRKISVPSRGDITDLFGSSGWSVSSLRQKINLISDNCAIAWAGSLLGAQLAISELRERAKDNAFSCADVLEYLNTQDELVAHPASFVGLFFKNGRLEQFQHRATVFEKTPLGTVYVDGSGSHVIQEFSDLMTSGESKCTGSPNSLEQGTSWALMLGGLLLQSEMAGNETPSTLLQMFGGGYEIAFPCGGRIQKLKEITYVFWHAAIESNNVYLSFPQFLVKQTYADDYLLIRSARIQQLDSDPSPHIVDEQRHVILPLFAPGTETPYMEELEGLSFESSLLCHCVSVSLPDRLPRIYTRVQFYGRNSEPTITFRDAKDQIVLGLRGDLMSEMAHSLNRFAGG